MAMTEREALKLALEALYPISHNSTDDPRGQADKAIIAINNFLAQPEQKPVGEVYGWHGVGVGQPLCRFNVTESDMPVGSLLYTAPPSAHGLGNV